jgi:PEGA domain
MQKRFSVLFLWLFLCSLSYAKDAFPTLNWPADKPLLQFTISKINRVGTYQGQQTYILDLAVMNMSGKRISQASFTFYLFDKQQVRIGQGYIEIANVSANETVKMQVNAQAVGTPASFSVLAQHLPAELAGAAPPKLIALTVYSVPSGAKLSVDGKEVGVTPIAAQVTPGSHTLAFNKEGYNPGTFPMVVAPDQLSGGSVSFELGSAAHDTIELRDGSVINGDLQSIDATGVVIMVGGNPQKFDRNQVKRVLLIEREQPKP